MSRPCAVIIPVFNAFDETRACIESVRAHSSSDIQVIVVDDASSEGVVRDELSEGTLSDPRIEIVRNKENLGYSGSCNVGQRLAGKKDVILLNSDTEVSAGWLDKLQGAAYSKENIGTVTPFTNTGNIASLPRFCQENVLPSDYSLDQFADIVERASKREYPELPSCVGHCVYIKREVLNRLGGFDEQTFARGYGEENDFSCRAQKIGYVDVLDDATFILHKDNASFGDEKRGLTEEASRIIQKRHPHYFDRVSRFCRANPLKGVRNRVLDKVIHEWNSGQRTRVLHILQDGPFASRRGMLGGTEHHVQSIIDNAKDVTHWSLVPGKLSYYISGHFPGGEREYLISAENNSLSEILSPDYFDLIHLHHSRWFNPDELTDALIAHGNYIVSLHDYIHVCPRFHLYTPFREVCDGHQCVEKCGYKEDYISEYRERADKLLGGAKEVITFSRSTQDWIKRILKKDYNWSLQRHGVPLAADSRSSSADQPIGEKLKVAFIGFLPQHKGSLIIEELVKHSTLPEGKEVEWHVVGKLFSDKGKLNIIDHGEYKREELSGKLSAVSSDLVVILSICPETFCLTLEEAWSAGLPALVTPHGAPAERVQESQAGWVLDELSADSVLQKLDQIVQDEDGYITAKKKAQEAGVISVEAEASNHQELYKKTAAAIDITAADSLFSFVEANEIERAPKSSLAWRLIGKLVDLGIYLLDTLRIRYAIQNWAYKALPNRLVESLKGAR